MDTSGAVYVVLGTIMGPNGGVNGLIGDKGGVRRG